MIFKKYLWEAKAVIEYITQYCKHLIMLYYKLKHTWESLLNDEVNIYEIETGKSQAMISIYIYCKDEIVSTIQALLDCPYTAHLWRNVEIRLRKNVEPTIKISEKQK